MQIEKIYIGGWFQRTMLHLTEIHHFLEDGTSTLRLNKSKLLAYREAFCYPRTIRYGCVLCNRFFHK